MKRVVDPAILLPVIRDIKEAAIESSLKQDREGIMIHFDGSTNDKGGISWLENKQFKLGYNRVYADNGDVYSMIRLDRRAPHAGVCRTSLKIKDANSAYYGLCALTNEKTKATGGQLCSMYEDVRRIYKFHMKPENGGWEIDEIGWRLRGHFEEAIFSKTTSPNRPDLWGKLGRKIDPKGLPPAAPVINMDEMRLRVADALASGMIFKA